MSRLLPFVTSYDNYGKLTIIVDGKEYAYTGVTQHQFEQIQQLIDFPEAVRFLLDAHKRGQRGESSERLS